MRLTVFFLALLSAPAWLSGETAEEQPQLVWKRPAHYRPGDRIDPELFVQDRHMKRVPLVDLIRPDTRVAVLIFFGGGFKELPPGKEKRGPLWCEDSFDDLPVQRALIGAFRDRPVQFIPIAVPPVYHSDSYGWGEHDFLDATDDSRQYLEAVRSFIQATEAAVRSTVLPFSEVYYDPRNRLAANPREDQPDAAGYPWQGKFRWGNEARRYGTPAFWFLDRTGQVLRDPLLGNDYDAVPPEIHYGFLELSEWLNELLERPASGSGGRSWFSRRGFQGIGASTAPSPKGPWLRSSSREFRLQTFPRVVPGRTGSPW